MAEIIRLLLVEDSSEDAELVLACLKREGWVPSFDRVEDEAGLRKALESGSYHAVISDFSLPSFDALRAVALVREKYPEIPFLVVSGTIGEEMAVNLLKAGANDYLMKDRLGRLGTSLRQHLEEGERKRALRRAQENLRVSEERYALAVRGTNGGIWDWDLAADRIFLSARWWELLGFPAEDRWGTQDDWFERVLPADRTWLKEKLALHASGQTPSFEHECHMMHHDGTLRWMGFRGKCVLDDKGRAARMAGSMVDITAYKEALEVLQRNELYDPVTGLPNAPLFEDRLKNALSFARRNDKPAPAVACIDLDGFRELRETLGRQASDLFLETVGGRLRAWAGTEGVAARLSGDEFAVLLPKIESEQEARRTAAGLLAKLAEPFPLLGREYHLSAGLGLVWGPRSESSEQDVSDARSALFKSKSRGTNQYEIFHPSMRKDFRGENEIAEKLALALERAEFKIHYQPIVHLGDGRLAGFEALLRWRPGGVEIPPAEFIPVAEETKRINAIGRWVLKETCRQIAAWDREGRSIPQVSINVSACQILEEGWAAGVLATVRETSLAPERLVLEVTESSLAQEADLVASALGDLRAAGFGIMIDDFGTGYSSLARLHLFPLSGLKVGRSFVSGMDRDARKSGIVSMVLDLAARMKLEVVSEGVETKTELELLRILGCPLGQGFLFSKPLPSEEASSLLKGAVPWKVR